MLFNFPPFFLSRPHPFVLTAFNRCLYCSNTQCPLLSSHFFLYWLIICFYKKRVINDQINERGWAETKSLPQLRIGVVCATLTVPNSLPLQTPFWLTTQKPSLWRKARCSLWIVLFLRRRLPPCSGWPHLGSPFFLMSILVSERKINCHQTSTWGIFQTERLVGQKASMSHPNAGLGSAYCYWGITPKSLLFYTWLVFLTGSLKWKSHQNSW